MGENVLLLGEDRGGNVRLGTLNVGPVSSKGRELVDMMAR